MRFLSKLKQLRFTISRNGDRAKTVLKTSYDIVSLPYLLSYVMGIFFEEYEDEDIGFSSSELTDMLLTMYPNDFAVSTGNADLVIDDLETWERNCSSYDIIRTIGIFKPKELNLSEKLFCKLKKHCKQNGFHAVYAETSKVNLIMFYKLQNNQRLFEIRRNRNFKKGNYIEIGLLFNCKTFSEIRTVSVIPYNKNEVKSVFDNVIKEINQIIDNEEVSKSDIFLNPQTACLEYINKHGYLIKPIEQW